MVFWFQQFDMFTKGIFERVYEETFIQMKLISRNVNQLNWMVHIIASK